ncbi:MAG TPA: DUF262 domain-containing HNH endonuclease family protein [Hyphomicrobiaceae bacterium]|nr:DUF262 domain-containing HNH endonuclease family protein [Hyphomicrobiaceae bacterium]
MPDIRSAALSLAELLWYRDRYTVPEFQRVYGWGETEVDRLFSDFETAMRDTSNRLFLGTIYLAAPADNGEALIADGQQRFLTATMIHAAARDLAEDDAEAERLHTALTTPAGEGFRFMPRERDAAFFRTWVQERGATLLPLPGDDGEEEVDASELSESQLNIIRNRDAIVERLRKLGPDGRRRLIEFHDRIRLVAITTDTVEEARNAYASTQTRGLRQSETDKLKAELIGDCPPAQRALLAGRWEECEAKLGRDEFTELFHHLIMIEAERRPQHALEADLFSVFDLPRKVASFIEDVLVPSTNAYHRICTAGQATTRKTRSIDAALVSLLRCTHGAWRAPGLLAVREFGSSPRELEQFLASFERLACVMMINGTDPHQMLERYVAVIRDIKRKMFAGPSLQLSHGDLDQARRNLQSPRFALRDRFRMPVLLKLNDLLAKQAQAIDPRNVSCEHILPVNPPKRGPWQSAFRGRNGQFNGGVFTQMLGNVTILTHPQNREADNSPYEVKRRILKASGFPLSKHAASQKVWNAAVIAGRSEQLFELLADSWRLRDTG